MSVHSANKAALAPLRVALRSGDAARIRAALRAAFLPEATIRLGHPFGDLIGPDALWDALYGPLLAVMPDMERRDFIMMAGPRWGDGADGDWVGLGGNLVGTLSAPWLGIPALPHGQPGFLRYHEYLRMEGGKVAHLEGLWDLPQLMVQAGVWPMAPQMGADWMCPGPADGLGVVTAPHDAAISAASVQSVWDMLDDLKHGTAQSPGRGLGGHWHPHAHWHGPTGLGTARGHAAIANRIFGQFRSGLTGNTRHLADGVFFGDGQLVAFTGWPSGTATHSGDGFLGLAPTGKRITRRSLDFWRIEDGLIQECWVMVDMLDLYQQLGVDVLGRMRVLAGQEAA